ncbi:MAG: PilZ domain-containing protein [Deltaproteobacteria bacterium]|nr:MAG: PilZ domain-containing protein [Deltaproteobacteria bacterium]
MKEPAWEKCQYYSSGHCPKNQAIDKAYLIPQLLEPSEIETAKKICEQCEKCHDEKRKYQRITRPLRVVVTNKEPKKNIEGTIVDVSINGALVKLDDWVNFTPDEMVDLQLYSGDKVSDPVETNVIKLSGRIKRLTKEKQELAIMFTKTASVKKCANI